MSCGWVILEFWNVALPVLTAATSPGGARPLCQASGASLGGWQGLPQSPTHLGCGRHAGGGDQEHVALGTPLWLSLPPAKQKLPAGVGTRTCF